MNKQKLNLKVNTKKAIFSISLKKKRFFQNQAIYKKGIFASHFESDTLK
jgi:hypothetical protein